MAQHVFRSTLFSNLFNLMRATVSNILENIVPMLPVILSSSSVVMGTTTVEINQAGHW